MKISFKNLLMGTLTAAAVAACASDGAIVVPEAPLEECVYSGDRTEFAVWAPDAEEAKLRLYASASDEAAFRTMDGCREGGCEGRLLHIPGEEGWKMA